MPKLPSNGKTDKGRAESPVLTLASVDEPHDLCPLNFRVSPEFHHEFKLYAVQHHMSMVELLRESFHAFKRTPRS